MESEFAIRKHEIQLPTPTTTTKGALWNQLHQSKGDVDETDLGGRRVPLAPCDGPRDTASFVQRTNPSNETDNKLAGSSSGDLFLATQQYEPALIVTASMEKCDLNDVFEAVFEQVAPLRELTEYVLVNDKDKEVHFINETLGEEIVVAMTTLRAGVIKIECYRQDLETNDRIPLLKRRTIFKTAIEVSIQSCCLDAAAGISPVEKSVDNQSDKVQHETMLTAAATAAAENV